MDLIPEVRSAELGTVQFQPESLTNRCCESAATLSRQNQWLKGVRWSEQYGKLTLQEVDSQRCNAWPCWRKRSDRVPALCSASESDSGPLWRRYLRRSIDEQVVEVAKASW